MHPDTPADVPATSLIEAAEPGSVLGSWEAFGERTIEIDAARIGAVCRVLKAEGRFDRLADLTAADWHPREPRFEVVYHLHSMDLNRRLRVKCRLGGGAAELDSVTSVWRSADWHEREVFDLFGIVFRGHPNLKRIMMPEDWDGHPLRKDYPIHGYRYSYKDE